jgi:hypothetical protein
MAFFIMLLFLYGIEENSWKQLYLECIEGDCQNGKGTMIYYSTQKYVGEFKDGQRHGQGTLYLPLQRVISGKWDNDAIIEGSATLSDGTRYTGGWQFGYRHGKGKLTYSDGREYVGEFHDGQKHGLGTMSYPDGRTYTGQYQKGQRTGSGTMSYPNGRKVTGQFSDGEYIGPVK